MESAATVIGGGSALLQMPENRLKAGAGAVHLGRTTDGAAFSGLCCPVVPFFPLFFGYGFPFKLKQKGRPFFSMATGHLRGA